MNFKYCVLVLVICEHYVESLRVGDVGVCVVKSSERKSRLRAYNVATNKMCGKRKCVVRKTKKENYMITKKNNVCCKGWEYNGGRDSCTPLCSTGCVGGRCSSPETCQCDPPLTPHPLHRNTCVKPPCDPPCVNADCVNGTCECHQNFQRFNGSHCQQCPSGFIANERMECAPYCDKCANGACTAPNVCTCNSGYELVHGSCEPICACEGRCIAPNTCECWDGFVKRGDKCEPCINGRVINATCECLQGYTRNGSVCQPVCSPECVNGFCSAPNTCSCKEGFEISTAKPCPSNCSRCDEDGKCVLGCVPDA